MRLCRAGRPPGRIATLRRNNATADGLPILRRWIEHQQTLGVRPARLRILEAGD